MSYHKANVFSFFKAAHICQVSPALSAAARAVPTSSTSTLLAALVSGFGSTTKSTGQMDLLSPLRPILLAQQKTAPYSGVGSRGGRRIEFLLSICGRASRPQCRNAASSSIQHFATTFKNDHTGGCTSFRPLTTICIYFTLQIDFLPSIPFHWFLFISVRYENHEISN